MHCMRVGSSRGWAGGRGGAPLSCGSGDTCRNGGLARASEITLGLGTRQRTARAQWLPGATTHRLRRSANVHGMFAPRSPPAASKASKASPQPLASRRPLPPATAAAARGPSRPTVVRRLRPCLAAGRSCTLPPCSAGLGTPAHQPLVELVGVPLARCARPLTSSAWSRQRDKLMKL